MGLRPGVRVLCGGSGEADGRVGARAGRGAAAHAHGIKPLPPLRRPRIGGAYTTAESRHIWRDFIDASARVTITDTTVEVRFGKRAHNPYLLDAGLAKTDVPVPWW